ncbi:MAG: calcium-binding protein [Paracoccaceae bacterium]
MPEITVRGDLASHLSTSLEAFRGDGVLGYFSIISTGGPNGYFTSLGGTGLSVPRSGPDAVLGLITRLSVERLVIRDVTEPAQIETQFEIAGLTLNASDLFDLVARTTTGVQVVFDANVMRAELNSQSWRITGSDGADRVRPTADLKLARNDVIVGGAGADALNAGGGNDTINGGLGADILHGSTGADRLIGGGGNDQLLGGVGSDVFIFAGNYGDDRVSDFQNGFDRLDLTGPYRISDAGRDTLILQGDHSIRLVGIDHTLITAADIL